MPAIYERTEWTLAFCQRWLLKANTYNDQCLNDAFDRFFTLYVAFNRLYNHADYVLNCNAHREIDRATKVFCEWVGHDQIWTVINREEGPSDIRQLRHLIREGGPFFLHSKNGVRDLDKERERKLYERLSNVERKDMVEAILEYLYLVRCNIFHGDKVLDGSQLEIIQPSTRCLLRILQAGMEKLEANPVSE